MQLRFYQRESIDAIYNYFNAGNKGNPVIALQTGLGKSVVLGICANRYLFGRSETKRRTRPYRLWFYSINGE